MFKVVLQTMILQIGICFYHSLDGKYSYTESAAYDLVKLVYDPIVNGSSITEKIQQIEQQLQELKALLKD